MAFLHDHEPTHNNNNGADAVEIRPLNVIIPIGGVGSRFAKEGYRYPKPLINIVGRPMLLWLIDHLSLIPGDTLWMAVNEEVDDEFRIGELIKRTYPKIDFKLLRLRHQTKGASETMYIISRSMGKEHLERRTVSLDCDTLYWTDILAKSRNLPPKYGACFYFHDQGTKPIFSYLRTETRYKLEHIVEIREKQAISDKANTGAYVFPSGTDLKMWSSNCLDGEKDAEVGEYFASQTIAFMITEGVPFLALELDEKDFSCVGTPEQLNVLLKQLNGSLTMTGPMKLRKRRFCFDLDGTLVGYPVVTGDYSTCLPIAKNVQLVQQLYKAGHHIIIQTARRMRTHDGNVGKALADIGPVTFAQLAKYDIPYHEIHFGKPWADVYIDDLAVNANLDTAREIGWLLDDPQLSCCLGEQTNELTKRDMIASRDFNTIQIVGDKVIKSSTSEDILGELYFYSHMPPELSHIFPKFYDVNFIPRTGTYNVTMEHIRGPTFSHLLVGRSITKGRLTKFLEALHKVHIASCTNTSNLVIPPALAEKFENHSVEDSGKGVNIYANYCSKIRRRYKKYRDRYDALGPLAAELFSQLDEILNTYEAGDKGVYLSVIHGDPVFSNAILTADQHVCFIDVRCRLGDVLTSGGDIHYDLAKVLQSLCGYDHILLTATKTQNVLAGEETRLLDEADLDLLHEMREHFFEFVSEKYGLRIHRKTLYQITASLFFSLIPLHDSKLGSAFLRMCQEALDTASRMPTADRFWSPNSNGLCQHKN